MHHSNQNRYLLGIYWISLIAPLSLGCTRPESGVNDQVMHSVEAQGLKSKAIKGHDLETIETDYGKIGPWNIKAMAPHIHRLVSKPASLTLKVGQKLELKKIQILAYDVNNKCLGELAMWNSSVHCVNFKIQDGEYQAKTPGSFKVNIWLSTFGLAPLPKPLPEIYIDGQILED